MHVNVVTPVCKNVGGGMAEIFGSDKSQVVVFYCKLLDWVGDKTFSVLQVLLSLSVKGGVTYGATRRSSITQTTPPDDLTPPHCPLSDMKTDIHS